MTNPHVRLTQEFFASLTDGELREDLIHPEMLMTNTEGFFIADEYRGVEGFRRWMKDLMGDLEEPAFTVEDVVEIAPTVLITKNRIHGHARTAGMDVDLVWWSAAGFRDGQIVRLAGARNRRHAEQLAREIAAGGLAG